MSDQQVKKLMELKAKLETHEENIRKNEAKRDALLEQAKQRFGVNSYAELDEYRNNVYARYEEKKHEVEELNNKLESFFTSVEGSSE